MMRLQDVATVLLGKQTKVLQAAHASEARGDDDDDDDDVDDDDDDDDNDDTHT
jgi:hypothetical protein